MDVLIIDDNLDARDTLTGILEDFGCTFTEAETGAEAIRWISEKPFDIIFLDLKLPDLSGVEVLARSRDSRRDQGPVVILTGHPDEQSKKECSELGAARYLAKSPIERDEVRVTFMDLVAARRQD